MGWPARVLLWTAASLLAGFLSLVLTIGLALTVAFPNLPDISDLSDYRPKLPLRIFSVEGDLLGEFGEERRNLTPIAEIPKVMTNAVLAIEDARFYLLSKDQILEIYMNQIFLGNRAYGFSAASEIYFGKPLKEITIAEAAMLAGLPKAPSKYNPISNPQRARIRQRYIIDRMVENGFISQKDADDAKNQELKIHTAGHDSLIHAEYIAEMVRQVMFNQYGDETYTKILTMPLMMHWMNTRTTAM